MEEEETSRLQANINNAMFLFRDTKNKGSALYARYGDIRWNTDTPREKFDPMIEKSLKHLESRGFGYIGFSTQRPKTLTTWEPKNIPAYLPFDPWIPGYSRPYAIITDGDSWYAVFSITNLPPTGRPNTGWPYTPTMNLAGTSAGSMYRIVNSQTPSCRCMRIEMTAVFFNVNTVNASSPLNVPDNGNTFFVVPQVPSTPAKWRMYVERDSYLQYNTVNENNICEWVTFDELCGLAHSVNFYTPNYGYQNNSMVNTFSEILGNPNRSQTKAVTWTWTFPEGIDLNTGDDLVIRVGTQIPNIAVLGQTILKNLTAFAYFEKRKRGLVTAYQNATVGLIVIP